MIAKSVIALLDLGVISTALFQVGLAFGTRYNKAGWDTGLTMLTCLMNLLPYLDADARPRALYQGLYAVARDSAAAPPHFRVHPLPTTDLDFPSLKAWFRHFIEQRDREAAERCLVTAVQSGMSRNQIAEMLFAAATDHCYLDVGHVLDFINKALEALDAVEWQEPEPALFCLVAGLAIATRMEESSSWRYRVDLVTILEAAFEQFPAALEAGQSNRGHWTQPVELLPVLLGEDAQAIVYSLLNALRSGCTY